MRVMHIHPTTPTNDPIPAPPTSPRQFPATGPDNPREATASTPIAAAGSLQLSIATWPELYRKRQLRSFHSISSRPHIRAMRPTPATPAPMRPPVPAERRRIGAVIGRRFKRNVAPLFSKPIALPIWNPRLKTWVARIVRAKGWSSAYSAVG